ncbi:MAG TPA: DNA topoisomerase IB [Ramlibacter sp.]|nr:DNA topoisomerase IB [Ramlibacter sp.]
MARVDDAREAAEEAGLIYVSDDAAGLSRERRGDGFDYRRANGDRIDDDATIERIRKLAIPPAWTDVWICPKANGHLQATGRDARGRKQYRYHPQFREVRDSTKYEHMLEFARSLPAIRERVAKHMALGGLPREKVLATVVHLLETTLIRVGNDEYSKENKSYGLTTLRNPHVSVEGAQLKFRFRGKSGKVWNLQLRDRRVAKIVRACQDLPGQRLFEYIDEDGQLREVASADVNAYLREITGSDVTAKDFRTWAGTVMAAFALEELEAADSQAGVKKNIKAAIERVAARLGNTPTICRKCYVHPEVLDCYMQGELLLEIAAGAQHAEEAAVLALLERRLSRTLEDQLEDSLDRARCAARHARRNARTSASGRRGSFQ